MAEKHGQDRSDRNDKDKQRAGQRDTSQLGDGMVDESQRAGSRKQGGGRESGSQSDRGMERGDVGSQPGSGDRERFGASGRGEHDDRTKSSDRKPSEGRRDIPV
jgi:hypothetical protein